VERIAVADLPELVDEVEVERRRDLVVADPLDLVGRTGFHVSRTVIGREYRADRVARDDPDLRVLLLQIARRAGDRPARAR
jgi:hypothetical protein